MKKILKKPRALTALALSLAGALCAVFCAAGLFNGSASAESLYDYSDFGTYAFYYEQFNVTYDIQSDRKISVTEELTVVYNGYESTGFMRDIPVNGGELVKNVKVTELTGGVEKSVYYDVYGYEDDYGYDYVTVDIGDYSYKKGQTHTYRLTYDYCLTKAQEGADKLALNAIAVQDRRVESADIVIKLPEGFLSATYTLGGLLSENKTPIEAQVIDGRSVISLTVSLAYYEGITFDLTFSDGALTTYFDFTPYWFVIAGAFVLILLFAVKFLAFNKGQLTPVVNFEAPDKMCPLKMGKLIDTTVDKEDITSMIFYWADKGYLKINLDNESDPLLIRVVQKLPAGTETYEATMFNELFRGKETVRPSELKYTFYNTIDRVTRMVNSSTKNLHSVKSTAVAIVFAVLGFLLTALAPVILGLTQLSTKFFNPTSLFMIVPLFMLFVICVGFKMTMLRKDKKRKVGYMAGIVLISLFFGFIYSLVVPSHIIGLVPKILIAAVSVVIIASSVSIISRTESYNKTLNEILGFRNFILLAEKDRLEKMLEDDPQFYYHILPYAQVLGISDQWEEKFESITVQPPQWSTGTAALTVFQFHMFNSMLNRSLRSMTSNMAARPQSAGGSGHGGFGGGHVGGGHGGGGSRGR